LVLLVVAYGLWSVDDLGIFNMKSGLIVQPVTEIPKGNNVFSCDVDLTFNRTELFISLEPMHDGFPALDPGNTDGISSFRRHCKNTCGRGFKN
jgi:hypothetical protein